MGISVPFHTHTCIDTNGSYTSYKGRQIQDGTQPGDNSFKVLYKICPPCKKEPTISTLSYTFGSLEGSKSKPTLYGQKRTHFFQRNTVYGKMYFSYENIRGECFQDLCHCALFASQMLSQECVQIIKTIISMYRNLSKPILPQKPIFTFLNIQNKALQPTSENLNLLN